ncbi:MAG: hypothetical protein V4709_12235 [Pseudomonadota bacterium]
MNLTLDAAIARFGTGAKAKLSNAAASGQPEDQLRAPFERLLADMAESDRAALQCA